MLRVGGAFYYFTCRLYGYKYGYKLWIDQSFIFSQLSRTGIGRYYPDDKIRWLFKKAWLLPALRLVYPKQKICVTAINGMPVPYGPLLLKALAKITVEGELLAGNESFASGFNGILIAAVLDSWTTKTTLGNNKVIKWNYTESDSSRLFKSYIVDWDLIGNDGGRLRPNIYFCRAAICSNGSKEATEAKKVVILG